MRVTQEAPLLEGLVLGVVQGITEWLPISSQGSVTSVGSLLFDLTLGEAIAFALWLHIGTAFSAAIAFRSDLIGVVREALKDISHPSPLLRFLVVGTLLSALIGFPVLMVLEDFSEAVGGGAMLVVGVAMLGTAYMLRARPEIGDRTRDNLKLSDALVFGIAQGFAAVPGFSRSGLTVAALLGRGVNKGEALALSFIMSIPASLGAALNSALDDNGLSVGTGVTGAIAAAVVGLVTIRALIAVARKINFAPFVAGLAVLVIAGGVFQITR